MKNQIEGHYSWFNSESDAQLNVVEARKTVRNEYCHWDAIKRNIKPNSP